MPLARHIAACAVVALAYVSTPLQAVAEFPERPIWLIVSFQPGSLGDTVGRIVADGLSARTGATIVIDTQRALRG